MIIAVVQLKWSKFRQNLMNGWNKRRNDQFIGASSARERSIKILQNRYGYTREEATSQLDKHYSRAWLG